MTTKRFSAEKMTSVLQPITSSVPIVDVCRQVRGSEQYRRPREQSTR
jgi:hypothetical protein